MTAPPNATATGINPAKTAVGETKRGLPVKRSKDVNIIDTEADRVVVNTGSGEYLFAETSHASAEAVTLSIS